MTDQAQNGQTEQALPAKPVDLQKARFRVELTGPTEDTPGTVYDNVRLMPGDVVGAERQFGIRASDMESGSKMEHMLYMVWLATRRKGYVGDFEVFIAEVLELDIQQQQGAGNPTQPVQ